MASKDKDLDLDEMDDFDDMDEFDEGDRNPSTTGYSKKQIVEDAGEFTKRLAFKTGKKVLPDEYGEGLDQMVQYKDYLSEIATTSKSKIGKEIGRLNKEVKKVLPGKLKGLSDKIDSFLGTNQDEGDARAGEEEQRNAFITSNLNSIFDRQIQAQVSMQADSEAKAEVSDKLNLVQTKKTHEFLMEIANNTSQSSSFSLQIAKEYYRKSLEIQYRSYYVQADMLSTMRNYYKAFSGQFDAISKNTALPEFVKLKQTERLKEFTRNKLMEEVYNRSLGKNEYLETLKKNFAGFISEKVEGLTDAISSATGGLSMFNEMGDAGMSTTGLVKDLAMDTGADIASDRLSDKYKDKVAKNKYVQAGKGYMSTLVKSPEVFFNTLAGKANRRLNQVDSATDNPIIGSITNTLSGMLDVFKPKGIDMGVDNESVLTNKNPAIFDGNVYRSITDVIPMYLRRILQKNTDLTGMFHMVNGAKLRKFKSAPELFFDYTNRKLDTLEGLKASIATEMEELQGKTSIDNVVQTVGLGKKMNASESKAVRKYVEKAKDILPAGELSADTLFENYQSNEKLTELVKKDPVLEEYIKSLTSKDRLSGKFNKKYAAAKDTVNYRLRQINDKGNIEYAAEILNSILHHNGDNTDLSFTLEMTEPIAESFKKYIVKDGGVLTEDNLVNYKPFAYIPADRKDAVVPIINAFLRKVFSLISDGNFADKGQLRMALGNLDRAIRDGDIVNPELLKTLRDYNRDLVDVTKKNGKLTMDISQVTKLAVKDDDATIDLTEFYVDKSVNNDGKAFDDLMKKASTTIQMGKDKVVATAEQIKTDVSGVKNIEDAKRLAARYAGEIKAKGTEVFTKTKADVSKSLGEIETFIKSTEEFKDLEKNVSEFSDKVKTAINDKLDLMKTRFAETIEHKESEIVAYEALKAEIASKDGLSQTDKDKQVKDLDAKIVLVGHEITALKAASSLLNTKVNITGQVKTYLASVTAYLTTLKASVDKELDALDKKA